MSKYLIMDFNIAVVTNIKIFQSLKVFVTVYHKQTCHLENNNFGKIHIISLFHHFVKEIMYQRRVSIAQYIAVNFRFHTWAETSSISFTLWLKCSFQQ